MFFVQLSPFFPSVASVGTGQAHSYLLERFRETVFFFLKINDNLMNYVFYCLESTRKVSSPLISFNISVLSLFEKEYSTV